MLSNDEICEALELSGKLLELHGENSFKVRAYSNASYRLSKLRYNFEGKTQKDIEGIEGIGKGIASKIHELIQNNITEELKELLNKTPTGVIEMLGVKGLGPKKVAQLWKELQIESVGELLYACNENRLTTLKGFGEKTQEAVKNNIEFKISNANKHHYATVINAVNSLVDFISNQQSELSVMPVGQIRRKCEIIDSIQILIDGKKNCDTAELEKRIPIAVEFIYCEPEEFHLKLFELTATTDHLNKCGFHNLEENIFSDEEEIYSALHLQYIEPELREGLNEVELAAQNNIPELITYTDLKGILHNHSLYSDGVHSLEEMAMYCKQLGFEYFGICDHSKTAVYAQGLSIEQVILQQKEIDKLNAKETSFKILKGIESDILSDGSLDYPEEILKTFDFIVASIHSNFKMTEEHATTRLIKAIENPYTSILGHPTGRLLLARSGYPIHHKKVIDACAANKVHIELNAHPYRLDIDWRWIQYCIEKNVLISINPDAHHKEGFHDMYYGVCSARKGMLTKEMCLNALSYTELINAFKK
ncbi:MAG: DNA polymerase/3'-5' exonuclease PolX [Sphingobacteriaceae bacterium]|nr:DNA polymerase/3'-5' exonuclease PolX [Sphingobacteriaceae bacterium]